MNRNKINIIVWTICGLLLVVSGFYFGKASLPKYLTITETKVYLIEVPIEVPYEVIKTKYFTRTIEITPKLRDFETGDEFIGLMAELDKSILILGGDCVSRTRLFVDATRKLGYYTDTEITQGGWHMVLKGFVGVKDDIWYYDVEPKRAWLAYAKPKGDF